LGIELGGDGDGGRGKQSPQTAPGRQPQGEGDDQRRAGGTQEDAIEGFGAIGPGVPQVHFRGEGALRFRFGFDRRQDNLGDFDGLEGDKLRLCGVFG